MTTTSSNGVRFTVYNRTGFEQGLKSAKTQKVRQWCFDIYHFTKEDVELIKELRCQQLVLNIHKYTVKPPKIEERNLIVSSFLNLRDIEELCVYTDRGKKLFASSQLHKFVYRYPISQTLSAIYLNFALKFNYSLAKGLAYA